MKRKLEVGTLCAVIFIDLFLIYININVVRYKASKKVVSTPNYVLMSEEVISADEKYEIIEDIQNKEEIVVEQDIETPEEVVESNIVYDNMTLDELAYKLNMSLNSDISDKGYLIASYSLEKGVDPYMALAIILQETGCKWDCSYMVKQCNNVGGQKGSGCGSYSYFESLDSGIMAFIDNLYNNYISYGLTTPELINPKYAADTAWHVNVNRYIEEIKAK